MKLLPGDTVVDTPGRIEARTGDIVNAHGQAQNPKSKGLCPLAQVAIDRKVVDAHARAERGHAEAKRDERS